MPKSRYEEIGESNLTKAVESPGYNHARIAALAKGVGDPQCYRGMAGQPPKFKVGDRVRVKEQHGFFYTQTPAYLQGATGIIVDIVYESPATEDEAWGHLDRVEWFYLLCSKHANLWEDDESSEINPNDTVYAEIPERWLELV
jgi:ribosomal protein L21E